LDFLLHFAFLLLCVDGLTYSEGYAGDVELAVGVDGQIDLIAHAGEKKAWFNRAYLSS
jgi:hypothetical protein